MREKHCRYCDNVKPISDFYRHTGGSSDGYRNRCKLCDNEARTNNARRRAAGKVVIERIKIRPRTPEPVPCPNGCHGMSWRVVGKKCRLCGLARAAEPTPTIKVWRGGNLNRAIDEMSFDFESGRKAS